MPNFRRHEGYTAFVEGWALYSERLGKEVGRYQDPYSNYGRLENEMWRAIRLVVDTGVHEKHWTRDQMVEYFHRYTAMDEPNIQSEVDRYIAWPGQALAYKLGQLQILKLREQARQQLGDKFNIRAFHDAVLANGALPLDVLNEQVTAWINAQHKAVIRIRETSSRLNSLRRAIFSCVMTIKNTFHSVKNPMNIHRIAATIALAGLWRSPHLPRSHNPLNP